ncbi:MAG: hypothetical protein COA78_36485 [Blastopirellula sp.]|nr:MAG: hypothetical protein COA78_36485 [Blastopirellula sp.]
MDIKDFVRETLVQIAEGVKEANSQLKEKEINAVVMPTPDSWSRKSFTREIKFDVAVIAESTTEMGGKANLTIPVVGVGFKGDVNHETSNQNISRVEFTVPIMLPNVQFKADKLYK